MSSIEVKVTYTGYLLFAFLGYLTFVLIGLLRVGPGFHDIVLYYRGSGDEELFPRAFGQMLEEAHFHAFIEGLTLLVLAHLFVATSLRPSLKVGIILLAFGSTLMDLASPWLIRYVAPGFALIQLGSWIVMAVTALLFIVIPLYEMWFKGEKK